ncbi:MAG: ABC transporter permease [bacterium]
MQKVFKTLEETITYKIFKLLVLYFAELIEVVGDLGINLYQAVKFLFTGEINLKNTIDQCSRFGFDSLYITLSMVGVSGMIIALEIAYEMSKQGAGNFVGSLVTLSMIKEIGPIMASFAIISMVGSSMAAEIGTMKVTEQVDALKILRVNPIGYLIVPRIIAGFVMMPFIVIISTCVGILGGMIASNLTAGISCLNYLQSVWSGLYEKDIIVCLIKSCILGGMISLICSSIGYKTEGGAMEVGTATTKAVVWSFVTIVIIDYIISLMFF